MANKTFLYIGAGLLLLIGLCLFGYGLLNVIGSTSAQGSNTWFTFGIGFACTGAFFLAGGIATGSPPGFRAASRRGC